MAVTMSFTSSSREGYEFVPALCLARDRAWQPLPVKLVRALRLHVVKHALWLLCSASGIRGIRPANVVESIHVCTRLYAAVAAWPCAGGESALLDLCHAFDDRPLLTGGATGSDWPPLHVSVAPAGHRSRLGVEFTSTAGMRPLCKGLAGRGLLGGPAHHWKDFSPTTATTGRSATVGLVPLIYSWALVLLLLVCGTSSSAEA